MRPGASAVIFDQAREKFLLILREDNGGWCLPGGGMDSGESASEACIKEVLKETGLEVKVTKLVSIYTTPDLLIEFPDGNKIQPVAFSFDVEITGGELGLSDEATGFGWYTVAEMEAMDMMENHVPRVHDAVKNRPEAVFQ